MIEAGFIFRQVFRLQTFLFIKEIR
jgi:hypothetical protein